MVTEGDLPSNKTILVKRVPENVPAMPISFILHKDCMRRGLILCLSNCLEWVDSSWCDLDKHESSWNLFDSNL